MPYFHHSKNLRICARKLNNNPTSAERMRWYGLLTNKQFGDDRFLRQWIIDRYILDFFCKELKLIVEVDGISMIMKRCMKEIDLEKIFGRRLFNLI